MPPTRICFYSEDDGTVPVLRWLAELRLVQPKAFAKCLALMRRLIAMGYELRRPAADYLGERIYELRVGYRGVNYRILYGFHGRGSAVVLHAFTKEGRIPEADLARAIRRMERFLANPSRHTHEEKDLP